MMCDKNGTFLWKPKTIRLSLFGHDDKVTPETFTAALQEIANKGWIKQWTIQDDDENYATFTPFIKWQSPFGTEAKSEARWPLPPEEVQGSPPRKNLEVSVGVGVGVGVREGVSGSVGSGGSADRTNQDNKSSHTDSKSTPSINPNSADKKCNYTNEDYGTFFGGESAAKAYMDELKAHAKDLIGVAKGLDKFPPRSWTDLHDVLVAADVPSLSAVTNNVHSRIYRETLD